MRSNTIKRGQMKKFIVLLITMLTISTMGFTQRHITLISPNGGEDWVRGSVHNIRWNSKGLKNPVKVTLWKNNTLVGLIAKDQPANCIFSWTVGNYHGGIAEYGSDYKIKISEQGGPLIKTEELSYGFFKIKSKFFIAGVSKEILPNLQVDMSVNYGQLHKDSWINIVVKNVGKIDTIKPTWILFMIYKIETKTLLKKVIKQIKPLKKGERLTIVVKHVFQNTGKMDTVVYLNKRIHNTFPESDMSDNFDWDYSWIE